MDYVKLFLYSSEIKYKEESIMEIYFKDDNLTIRTLTYSDAEEITQEECAQGWNASIDNTAIG